MFAKLFERDGFQVLILNTVDEEDKPCITISIKPEGFGICSSSEVFSDNNEGYENCDKAFESIDEEKAFELAESQILVHVKAFEVAAD